MPAPGESSEVGSANSPQWFATTHWSVVLAAGSASASTAREALERLCRTYWYPLYAYVRRRGHSAHDAQDLTQGFFTQLIERNTLQTVARDKGRFRSFLLASINYFLSNERDRASAQKRGGGCQTISFDVQTAEDRYRLEPVDERSPETIFEQRWAVTLLDRVLGRLGQEFTAGGKRALFEQLRPFLIEGARTKTYAEAARELGLTEEAFKKAVQRLRRNYHQCVREEIAHTVGSLADVEDELRHLCKVLSRGAA